jgi:hypothetical protein
MSISFVNAIIELCHRQNAPFAGVIWRSGILVFGDSLHVHDTTFIFMLLQMSVQVKGMELI